MNQADTTIHFVPHTHWDREWYEPFQVFRMRLVDLIDSVLAQLERESDFRFTLDGQLATIDDYLEIRPAREGTIRGFVEQGRLAIGPWQILMDEFLVSGETIVRNLQHGWRRAQDFGGAMNVGYLPDMFGHIAQMPQILRRAGIGQAVVWRGVPAQVTTNCFRWRAPDGSEVDAEYLVGGYGNAAYLLEVPGSAQAKVRGYRDFMGSWYGTRALLAMYGTDHMAPMPQLVSLLRSASTPDLEVRIETLGDYMASEQRAQQTRTATVVEGELRSAARANMLMGVTSAHVDIKRGAAHAERWLSRYAEPLTALHGAEWPERLLQLAWGRVIECSAHDSICGCSVDPVAAQVVVRLAEAEQIARELSSRAISRVAASVTAPDWTWFNPSSRPRTGLVELDVLASHEAGQVALKLVDGQRVATQELTRNTVLLHESVGPASDIVDFLARRPHGRELFGRFVNGSTIEGSTVSLQLDEVADPAELDVDSLFADIRAMLDAHTEWTLRVNAAERRRLVAMVHAPALGFGRGRPVSEAAVLDQPVVVGDQSLDNGLVKVSMAVDGTLTIERDGVTLTGAARIVDGGDAGDSYNYGPPATDELIDTPVAVQLSVAARGPVVGELLIQRTYRLPVGLSPDRAARSAVAVDTHITMRVELRAGEPFVRLGFELDNRSDDHRLRAHFPLAAATDRSTAQAQYAVVERGLTTEAGHGEFPLPTFPAYSWVDAGGAAALLDHVTEYEVLDRGRELALTLLRSIGFISRNDNPSREDPAGPERPMPAAQMRGHQHFKMGLLAHAGTWQQADLTWLADQFALDFLAGRGRAAASPSHQPGPVGAGGLTVAGDGVVMTALYRRDDWLELRLVAESDGPTVARIGDNVRAARTVDLLGRELGPLEIGRNGSVAVPLGPWEIRTIQIRR